MRQDVRICSSLVVLIVGFGSVVCHRRKMFVSHRRPFLEVDSSQLNLLRVPFFLRHGLGTAFRNLVPLDIRVHL